jgi:hypothetical protein
LPPAEDEGDAGALLKGMKRVSAMGQFEIQGCVQNCTDGKSGQNHNFVMLSDELIETQALKVPCLLAALGAVCDVNVPLAASDGNLIWIAG